MATKPIRRNLFFGVLIFGFVLLYLSYHSNSNLRKNVNEYSAHAVDSNEEPNVWRQFIRDRLFGANTGEIAPYSRRKELAFVAKLPKRNDLIEGLLQKPAFSFHKTLVGRVAVLIMWVAEQGRWQSISQMKISFLPVVYPEACSVRLTVDKPGYVLRHLKTYPA